MALGAQRGNILAMTLGDSMRLMAIGLVVGGLLAWPAGKLLESLLAGVKPNDPGALGAAALLALLMTLAGSALPALRAIRIDPATAIRAE
jgi:ABC-type antimicrobial peptide transport system permease subunit